MKRGVILGLLLGVASCGEQIDVLAPDLSQVPEPAIADAVERFREDVAEDPTAANWGKYGDLLQTYDWDREAIESYQRAMELDPDGFVWPYRIGIVQSRADVQSGLASLNAALALDERYAPLHVRLARTKLELGDSDAAREHFEAALALDEDNAAAQLALCRMDLDAGKTEEATIALESLLESHPRLADVHETLARAYFASGEAEKASEHADQARRYPRRDPLDDPRGSPILEPISSRDFLNSGVEFARQNRLDDAVRQFEEALELEPGFEEAFYNLGLALSLQGWFVEAQLNLEKALEINPKNEEARNRLAEVYANQSMYKEARNEYLELVERNRDSADLHRKIGELFAREGDLPNAITFSRKAVELAPGEKHQLYQLAFQLMESRAYEESVEYFQKVIELDEGHILANNNLGIMLGQLGQLEAALTHFRKVLETQPEHAGAKENLANGCANEGTRHLSEGNYEKAQGLLEEALELKAGRTAVQRELAWLLATHPDESARDPKRALDLAEDVWMKVEDTDTHALETLAAAYAANARFEEAVETAMKAHSQALDQGKEGVAKKLGRQIKRYQAERPPRPRGGESEGEAGGAN